MALSILYVESFSREDSETGINILSRQDYIFASPCTGNT